MRLRDEHGREEVKKVLYHFTSVLDAHRIVAAGFHPGHDRGDVYLTNSLTGDASWFGDAAVVVEVGILDLTLDDEFCTGEVHYRCHYSKVRPVALLMKEEKG